VGGAPLRGALWRGGPDASDYANIKGSKASPASLLVGSLREEKNLHFSFSADF
jgi:hypothetical protein